MRNAPAAAPPPPSGPVTAPRSAAPSRARPTVPALPGSECAVSYPPPPVALRSPPTTPTSGTRATPAATRQPALERVLSP